MLGKHSPKKAFKSEEKKMLNIQNLIYLLDPPF